MKKILLVLLFGVVVFCIYRHMQLSAIQIGDLTWVYLGDNISKIQYKDRILVGPGYIEVNISPEFVCGNFSGLYDLHNRWFVIKRCTGDVYVGESADEAERRVCGVASVPCLSNLKYSSFITMKSEHRCK